MTEPELIARRFAHPGRLWGAIRPVARWEKAV